MAKGVRVSSEIGRLRRVVVHAPGPELLAVTPSNRRDYLYDDIIDLDGAAEEHRRFTSILRRFADVLEVSDLLRETLQDADAREFLIKRSEETAQRAMKGFLGELSVDQLVESFIHGWQQPAGVFSERLEKPCYTLPPLPNLFFTRDASMVVGNQAIIAAMRYWSRWPEQILMRTIFGFHPDLAGTEIIYDGTNEARHDFMVEGGDVHPVSEDTVLVGLSERTNSAALDQLTETLFAKTDIAHVFAVVLPERSFAIHLDMVWTQIDREACIAHPPVFRGPTRSPVLHMQKGKRSVVEEPSLFEGLKGVGLKLEPVWAGGEQWAIQEREQWASGCNFLSVAPGQALSYARNEATLKALDHAGFRIVTGEELLLGDDHVEEGDRAIITFAGSELVRGGGGPRCMTCPLDRDPL